MSNKSQDEEVDNESDWVQRSRQGTKDRRRSRMQNKILDAADDYIKIISGLKEGDPNNKLHRQKLDADQKKFVTSNNSHITCSAGPGSGKTFSLVSKIVYLISKGMKPNSILTITYTKKARKEFDDYFSKIFSSDGLKLGREERPKFLTFHKFASEFLKSKFNENTTGKKLDFIEEELVKKEIKNIKKKLSLNISLSEIQKIIRESRYKMLQNDNKIETLSPLSRRIYTPYKQFIDSQQKEEILIVDFMGLLLQLNKYLSTGLQNGLDYCPDPKKPRERIKIENLLVDEAQDTNKIMMSIIEKIARHMKTVTSVGDKWQQIHGYSGLTLPDFSDEFRKLSPNVLSLRFLKNYRSHKSIQLGISSLRSGVPPKSVSIDFEHRMFHMTSFCRRFTVFEQYDILIDIVPPLLNLKKTVYILFRRKKELESFQNHIKKKNTFLNQKNRTEKKNYFEWIENDQLTITVNHQIKGGEADIVFICNTFEMNFPCYREFDAVPSDNPFNTTVDQILEDEKKLFYVSISRPKQILVILSPTTVQGDHIAFRHWPIKRTFPSCFIRALGKTVRKINPSTEDPTKTTSYNLVKSFGTVFLDSFIQKERKKMMEDEFDLEEY